MALFRLIYYRLSDIIVILCLDAREFRCKRTWKDVHDRMWMIVNINDVDDSEYDNLN